MKDLEAFRRATAKFEGLRADYWTCEDDGERLTHTDPLEALEDHIDGYLEPGCDTVAEIESLGTLTLTAYQKDGIKAGDVRSAAEWAIENACEKFSEEYGDPDGDDFAGKDTALLEKYGARFEALIVELWNEVEVWRCEPCGTVTLETAEAIALMRVHRADWFEKEET